MTGGSRGIGRATAQRFAAEGDTVVVGARRAEDVTSAVEAISAAGGRASGWTVDVADAHDVEVFFARIVDEVGVPEVGVLSAGLGHWSPVHEMTDEYWHQTMRVNVDGAFFCTRAFLRVRDGRRGGHLVYLSSVMGSRGVPNMAAYAASKAAVATLADSVAREVKSQATKVTVISPGTTSTGMREHQHGRPQTPDVTEFDLQLRPEDVADAIFWAASASAHAFPTSVVVEPPGAPAR